MGLKKELKDSKMDISSVLSSKPVTGSGPVSPLFSCSEEGKEGKSSVPKCSQLNQE